MNRNRSWRRAMGVGVCAVCIGLAGCGDDEEDPVTDPVVAAEAETGGGAEEAGVEPDAPLIEADGEEEAAEAVETPNGFLNVCTGRYENENGSAAVDASLNRTGNDVTGVFGLSGGRRGQVTGTVSGYDMVIILQVQDSAAWIRMEGELDETGTRFSGTWTDQNGNTGTCWLRNIMASP